MLVTTSEDKWSYIKITQIVKSTIYEYIIKVTNQKKYNHIIFFKIITAIIISYWKCVTCEMDVVC